MANVVDLDQGHTKPVTDTKQRLLHPAREDAQDEEDDRYPIACKITVANVPIVGSYTCKELRVDGGDVAPERIHENVRNISGAILEVNSVVVLYHNPEDKELLNEGFFFADTP